MSNLRSGHINTQKIPVGMKNRVLDFSPSCPCLFSFIRACSFHQDAQKWQGVLTPNTFASDQSLSWTALYSLTHRRTITTHDWTLLFPGQLIPLCTHTFTRSQPLLLGEGNGNPFLCSYGKFHAQSMGSQRIRHDWTAYTQTTSTRWWLSDTKWKMGQLKALSS